ncbi:MAG: zinc-ribbon domain-containing protein [Candidatus Helarchaeales archaeon]
MSDIPQKRKCPNCGFTNFPASAKFCPKCGLKLGFARKPMKRHSRRCTCGVVYETIKLSWCPYCGKPLPKLF